MMMAVDLMMIDDDYGHCDALIIIILHHHHQVHSHHPLVSLLSGRDTGTDSAGATTTITPAAGAVYY